MKTSFLFAIFLLVLMSACERQESQDDKQKQDVVLKQTEPMAGDVLAAEAKGKLLEAKDKLIQEGKYSCCIKDPCNYCLLHEASCTCYKDLEAGKHVCIECYAGWQQGKGAVENIKKQNVTTDFIKHEHKH